MIVQREMLSWFKRYFPHPHEVVLEENPTAEPGRIADLVSSTVPSDASYTQVTINLCASQTNALL